MHNAQNYDLDILVIMLILTGILLRNHSLDVRSIFKDFEMLACILLTLMYAIRVAYDAVQYFM